MELWDIYNSHGNKTGKISERGNPLNKDEYHLVVFVWIRNSKGEYLVSRRSEIKSRAGLLETVGGSAIQGEDSTIAVLRELNEELGIKVSKNELQLLNRNFCESYCSYIADVWLIERDIDINTLVLQKEEVAGALWLKREQVTNLIEEKNFLNWSLHKELVDLNLI